MSRKKPTAGFWDTCTDSADYGFYNINEESANTKAEWHLELGSDVDVLVVDYPCVFETETRLELAAEDSIYQLEFPNTAMLQKFKEDYSKRLFENMFGLQDTAANRKKVTHALDLHNNAVLLL